MKPKTDIYKIDKKTLDSLVIPNGSNLVIVKITHQNAGTTTDSGIIVVGDQDYKPAAHAERWGYVYRLPDSLLFEKGNVHTMPWETEIECKKGDMVWFDMRAGLYAYTFEYNNIWYKLLNYSDLYAAYNEKRGLYPLNGLLLLGEYVKEKSNKFQLEEYVDERFAMVLISGAPNKQYVMDFLDDDIDVLDGDMVIFEAGTKYFSLDDTVHRNNIIGDTKYVLQQRKRIVAVERDDEIILHKGAIGIKAKQEHLKDGNITLLQSQSRTRVADVVVSQNDSIPVGAVILVSRKKGTEYQGIEYMMPDNIMYYETA